MAAESPDHYAALGLRRTATADDIKRAFRRIAQQHHPDRTGHDPAAAERFRAVNEAYEVLGDPDRRRRYDALGSDDSPLRGRAEFAAALKKRQRAASTPRSGPLEPLLAPLRATWRRVTGRAKAAATSRGPSAAPAAPAAAADDGALPLVVTFEQAFARAKVPHRLDAARSGDASSPRTLHVRLPFGVKPGTRIRLAGQGTPRPDGPPGDLLLAVAFAPHADFRFDGEQLVRRFPVSAADAQAGASLPLELPGGETIRVKVPPGAAPGLRLRVRGRGLPTSDTARGDLHLDLTITP